MVWQHLAIATVLFAMIVTTACTNSAWPLIIASAQAAAQVTSIFYPAVGQWSGLAVGLLQQVEAASTAYTSTPTATTEQKLINAINSIEIQLPQDLANLGIPVIDQQKVLAVQTIILDFVEGLAGQLPVTKSMVATARVSRQAGPAPAPMTKAQVKTRWAAMCSGDQHCLSLVK
jgi:hypothetical protein